MKRYQALSLAGVSVFALFAALSFFASKHVPEQPTPKTTKELPFTVHYDVKTVLELPPGIVPAESDRIVAYSRNPDGPTLALDADSVKQNGNLVDFTIVVFNPEGVKTPDGEVILGSLVGQHLDCSKHTYQPRFVVLIGEHGKVLSYMSDFTQWKTIAKGSVGQKVESLACKKQPESV